MTPLDLTLLTLLGWGVAMVVALLIGLRRWRP